MKVTLYPAENPPKSPSPVNSAPITYTNSRKPDNYHSDPVWWTTKQIFISLTVVAILWWTGCLLSGLKIAVEWVGFSAPSGGGDVALANTAVAGSGAAPVTVTELSKHNPGAYISRFAALAVAEMEQYGIPASISIAQGLVESNAGDSKLARNNNNHFGIKCFSRICKRGHCSNFTDDTHKDFFRKFKSPWESWRAHSLMLSQGRYQQLKQHGKDYKKWAYGLKSVGYATDPAYAEKLIGVIETYQLHKFDQ